jgi:hypothetical protein
MATYGSIRGTILDATGVPIDSVTVTVKLTGTSNLATLYTDRDGIGSLGNPFTNESDGSWVFFADNSLSYDITFAKTGVVFDNTDYVDIAPDVLASSSLALGDSVADETSFGISPDAGAASDASKSDHTHGSIASPITVPNGGTGDTTLTNHGLLVGQGTSAVVCVAAGAVNKVLMGQGASSDPAWADLPYNVLPIMDNTGAVLSNAGKIVKGVGSGTINLSGNAVFSGTTTYSVFAMDDSSATGSTPSVYVTYNSGSQFVIHVGTGGSNIHWCAIGY